MRREMTRDWLSEQARTAEVVAQASHIASSAVVSAVSRVTPTHAAAPATPTVIGATASHRPNMDGMTARCAQIDLADFKSAQSGASPFPYEATSTEDASAECSWPEENAANRIRAGQFKRRLVSLDQIDQEWLPPGDSKHLEPEAEAEAELEIEGNPLPDHWAAVSMIESPCPGEGGVLLARPGPSWKNMRLRYNPENRLLTPAQRREILRRDGYQCSTPDCPNTLWPHTHHIAFYAAGVG